MGVVPKKTKAEQRIMRHISITKVLGFIITLSLAYMIGDMFIYQKVSMLFIIFCVAEFFIVTSKSPSDPTKNFFAGWLDWLGFTLSRKQKFVNKKEEDKLENIVEVEKE